MFKYVAFYFILFLYENVSMILVKWSSLALSFISIFFFQY